MMVNKPVKGIIHIGAHKLEELAAYQRHYVQDIIWIEAQKAIVDSQKRIHPTAQIYQLAVSDKDDEVLAFHITNNGESSSLLEFGTHALEHPHVHVVQTVQVTTSRLDTWIRKNNIAIEKYNFVNLDIQGVELKALIGLGEYIRFFDYVYVEVNEKELYKGCALIPEVDRFLEALGFQRVRIKITRHGWGDALYSRF